MFPSCAFACFDVVDCEVGRFRFQRRLAHPSGREWCVHFWEPAGQLDLIHCRCLTVNHSLLLAVCRKANPLPILGPTAGFGGKQTNTQRHNKSESWNLFQSRGCHTAPESLLKRIGLFGKDLFDQNRKKVGLLAWIEVLLQGNGD